MIENRAKLGKEVNVGAGTITANYDGLTKNPTVIGDRSKTGANSVLVAPIVIGSEVTVGAGSTLTKSVPNGALAIERSKQLIKEGWSRNKDDPLIVPFPDPLGARNPRADRLASVTLPARTYDRMV